MNGHIGFGVMQPTMNKNNNNSNSTAKLPPVQVLGSSIVSNKEVCTRKAELARLAGTESTTGSNGGVGVGVGVGVRERAGTESKKKRRRTTVVCLNCKKRKIKCDRKKPACGNCVSSNAAAFCFYAHPEWAIDNYVDTSASGLSQYVGAAETPAAISSSHVSSLSPVRVAGYNNVDGVSSTSIKEDVVLKGMDVGKLGAINNNGSGTGSGSEITNLTSQQLQTIIAQLMHIQSKVDNIELKTGIAPPSAVEGNRAVDGKVEEEEKGIDFYQCYDSLEMKRSSDVDYKPLTVNAMCNKDPYLSLLFKYYGARSFSRQIQCKFYNNKSKQERTARLNKVKEANITHSMVDMMEMNNDIIPPANTILDKNNKNHTFNTAMSPFSAVGSTGKDSKGSLATQEVDMEMKKKLLVDRENILGVINTNLSGDIGEMKLDKCNKNGFKQKMGKECLQNESLKLEIIALLNIHKKVTLDYYFEYFWKVIYISFPIFDEKDFRSEINRIIKYQVKITPSNTEEKVIVDLDISKTFDLVTIAVYLTMVRFSCLTIMTQLRVSDLERQMITKFKIGIDFIKLVNKILGTYKIFRKSKLIILQALALLKYYSIFSIEDGDGGDLTQGLMLNTIVSQLTFNIGLNRDPSLNQHVNNSKNDMYLHRKIWWCIVSMDRRFCTISGTLSIFSTEMISNYCNTKFPDPRDSDNNNMVEQKICDIYQKSMELEGMFTEVVRLVNKVNNFAKISELDDKIAKIDQILDEKGFSVCNFVKIKDDNNLENNQADYENNEDLPLDDHKLNKCIDNFKILDLRFIAKNLKISLYHALLIHYETKEHYDYTKAKMYLNKLLTTIVNVCDVSHNYLSNKYQPFMHNKFDFHINRLLQAQIGKCSLILSTIAVRCCFGITMLEPSKTREKERHYVQLSELALNLFNEMGSIFFNNVGVKYYQGYKFLLTLRFLFRVLNYYPVKYTGIAIFQYFMEFYNDIEHLRKDPVKNKKALDILDHGRFLKNIKLHSSAREILSDWNIHEGLLKKGINPRKYQNIFLQDDVILESIMTLESSNALRNQLFEFKGGESSPVLHSQSSGVPNDSERRKSQAFNGNDKLVIEPINEIRTTAQSEAPVFPNTGNETSDSKHDNTMKEKEKEDHAHHFDSLFSDNGLLIGDGSMVVNQGHQNKSRPFFIVTEHNPRNILNDDGEFGGIPSLLSDDKLVRELVPGLTSAEDGLGLKAVQSFLEDENELFPTGNPFSIDKFFSELNEAGFGSVMDETGVNMDNKEITEESVQQPLLANSSDSEEIDTEVTNYQSMYSFMS